jgi:hypothetical protein
MKQYTLNRVTSVIFRVGVFLSLIAMPIQIIFKHTSIYMLPLLLTFDSTIILLMIVFFIDYYYIYNRRK